MVVHNYHVPSALGKDGLKAALRDEDQSMPVGVQIWKRAEASFGVGGLVWVWHTDFCAQWVRVDSDDSLEA